MERYEDRNLSERFWHDVNQPGHGATRSEKTGRNCLTFFHVASIMVLLK